MSFEPSNHLPSEILNLSLCYRRVFAWTGDGKLNAPALLVLIALFDQPGLTPGDLKVRCELSPNRTSEGLQRLRREHYISDRPVHPGASAPEYLTDKGITAALEFLRHAAPNLTDGR